MKGPATIKDPSKLSTASLLNSDIGIYEPVITIVFLMFSNMKLSVDAVYAIVSVP